MIAKPIKWGIYLLLNVSGCRIVLFWAHAGAVSVLKYYANLSLYFVNGLYKNRLFRKNTKERIKDKNYAAAYPYWGRY